MAEEYVNMSIDGARLRVSKGISVLDAALQYGVCIPHLCHMPEITALGACRVCVVEVGATEPYKVTASCTLEVEEGMVVRAHSPRVLRIRKNLAEMLVAEAPNSRAVQDLASRCGVTSVRYPFRNQQCVLCGRCVRVCDELWQSESLGFVGRGQERRVALPFDTRPEYCKQCNSCIDVCPMTITPCDGPMVTGQEYLCGKCESQLSMITSMPDACVWCRLGEGFACIRQTPEPVAKS